MVEAVLHVRRIPRRLQAHPGLLPTITAFQCRCYNTANTASQHLTFVPITSKTMAKGRKNYRASCQTSKRLGASPQAKTKFYRYRHTINATCLLGSLPSLDHHRPRCRASSCRFAHLCDGVFFKTASSSFLAYTTRVSTQSARAACRSSVRQTRCHQTCSLFLSCFHFKIARKTRASGLLGASFKARATWREACCKQEYNDSVGGMRLGYRNTIVAVSANLLIICTRHDQEVRVFDQSS